MTDGPDRNRDDDHGRGGESAESAESAESDGTGGNAGRRRPELAAAPAWTRGVVVFALTTAGTFLTGYLAGGYQSPGRTAGLLGASALLGLAAAVSVVALPLFPPVGRLLDKIARNRRTALALALALLIAVGAVVGLGPQVTRLTNEWWGCAPSTEFTVVTTPAVRTTADALLAAFEASTAQGNHGCPTARGFVYDAPEDQISTAVSRNWLTAPDGSSYRRNLGPRPDVWLTESSLPVNLLADNSPTTALGSVHTFGLTQMVLALPAGTTPPADGTSLPRLVATESKSIGVVRPDPLRSTVGLLATAALYGLKIDKSPLPPIPIVDGDLYVEQHLGAAASARAFPDSDEGGLLCRFRQLQDSRPALILSEQAVRRYNAGLAVAGCGDSGMPPSQLDPVYPTAPALDHKVVRLRWAERPKPPAAAEDFEQWLLSTDGQQAVEATKLRPVKADDEATANLVALGNLAPGLVAQLREQYLGAHRPRRDLLAVDVSGSMEEPSRVAGQSRLTAVRQAVASAVCGIRPNDEIGLWVFPGASDRGPRPVVPPARGGCGAVTTEVDKLVPKGNTPLLQTLRDGVDALRATDGAEERRLVVVTDGEDTSSTVTRDDVLEAVAGAPVKVYLVTLGDVTCAADPLQEVAVSTGGRCYDAGPTADQIRDALGG